MSRGMPEAALPPPSADAAAHSARLVAALRERLADQPFLPFDEYMQHVLYAPGLGYYAAGSAKLGPDGDFITAPEISPLFGAAIAAAVAPVLERLGEQAALLEYGAGSGALAVAVLTALADADRLPARYSIVEVSPDLRARQQQQIATLPPPLRARVQWLDRPPGSCFRGVVLANEVLDAMPVVRFVIDASAPEGILEEGVEAAQAPSPPAAGQALRLSLRPARAAVVAAVRELESTLPEPLPDGYCSEIAPRRDAWLETAAGGLEAGLMLLIDYGLGAREYYAPERRDGTLICHYRHRAHADPLFYPGLQDLTAWVDFSAIAAAARGAGLAVTGFTTQAGFLLGNGIDALAGVAFERATSEAARARLASGLRTLLLPGEMGERFRVLALHRGEQIEVRGFAAPDLLRTL
jgi:SAM-dependent MidA family methyltransferase